LKLANGCNTISSANGLQYTLGSADDGNTSRFGVTAANPTGDDGLVARSPSSSGPI
jgi:hypothetical protein